MYFLWKQCCSLILQQSLFLESWMHLSDGSAKVVTLNHHTMRASNDCLRDVAISSNVFENISDPTCFLAARQQPESFLFELLYQLVVRYGAQSCEMALWSSRLPQCGNSITSLGDPSLRFKVPRQRRRPQNSNSTSTVA